jgi:uncharacterized damage-inducible protein DinB
MMRSACGVAGGGEAQMDFDLALAVSVLARTPRVLRALLADLDPAWTHSDYGEATFSPFDVVGHLIHGEATDWIPRARLILEHGSSRPFESYDRYAQFEDSRGRTLAELLEEFEQRRAGSLASLQALQLTPELLASRGLHPVLGTVTLSQLLAAWVVHDLNHIAQIARCMATQYGAAVGPWQEFLSVLKAPVTRMDETGVARKRAASS